MLAQHWMGDSFRDSLCRTFPSGDANVWPFFFGIFDDRAMRRRAFACWRRAASRARFRCATSSAALPGSELPVPRLFTPNYQGDPSWTQLGPVYLHLLEEVDRPRMERHRATMAALIERDRNYLEMYTPERPALPRPRLLLSRRRGHDLGGDVPRPVPLARLGGR